jgi:apolipoprotein N-acyltransferase
VAQLKRTPGSKSRQTTPKSSPARARARASQRSGVRLDSPPLLIALLAVSLLLQSLLFSPLDIWPAAFICLAPWFIAIAVAANASRVYLASYALGLAFFLVNMRWLAVCTVEGYLALSAYLAIYYPLVACPLRHAARRRGLPLALVAPVVWVGSEWCRAVVITGFPWFFLGHSQYKILTMIQISDLVGAYGVSFVLAAVNGALADVVLSRFGRGRAGAHEKFLVRPRVGAAFAAVLLLCACVYGQVQLRRDTSSPGPLVAVLQQDYPNFVDPDRERQLPGLYERADSYEALFAQAGEHRPDLFLLPETPWHMALNPEIRQLDLEDPDVERWMKSMARLSRYSYTMLTKQAVSRGAYVVTGGMAVIPTPNSLRAEDTKHNSAYVLAPDGSSPQRYDKVHCVIFGEMVPFRYGRLRFLYLWLNPRMPFSDQDDEGYEYSLTPGKEFRTFSMTPRSQPDRTYRFGVPICYEDVMPYVSRRFVTDPRTGEKRVDFLLNISNDGWFVHSNELPQHLAICAFRAVENRVGIARAVNTGISGFIDADGRIHDLVQVDGRSHGPGITGYSVARVEVDSRHSVYSRTGDVLAVACALLSLVLYVDYISLRVRKKNGES